MTVFLCAYCFTCSVRTNCPSALCQKKNRVCSINQFILCLLALFIFRPGNWFHPTTIIKGTYYYYCSFAFTQVPLPMPIPFLDLLSHLQKRLHPRAFRPYLFKWRYIQFFPLVSVIPDDEEKGVVELPGGQQSVQHHGEVLIKKNCSCFFFVQPQRVLIQNMNL